MRKDLPETAELVTDVLRRADRKGLYLAMRSIMLGRPDLTHLLPRITAPTLLVAGGDDSMRTAAKAGAAAAQLPRGRAATIASTRHMPALEAPDQVISLITGLWAAAASSDVAH